MGTHKDLIVWQKSIEFVTKIYSVTNSFPKEEIYGTTSQLRRASVSIPSNIAEGFGRKYKKELKRFLNIALGSATEIETLLIISSRLKYLSENEYNKLMNDLVEIIKMLSSLIKTINP